MTPAPSAGKRVRASYDWFCFTFDWFESGMIFLSQSQSVAMQNQRNHEITLDIYSKTAVVTK